MSQWVMSVLMLPLLLLLPLGQAAPKDGATRLDPKVQQQQQLLPNPFQPGPEQLRLLKNCLKGLENMDKEPEHMDREQVILYLFAFHDYDQSGQLDGLELLSMLTAALAPGAVNFPINPVILVVDKVLETQDLNGDGLMSPAELINFPGEAPKHTGPPPPVSQESQAVGGQPPLPKNPSRSETQESLGPREETEDRVEARRESLDSIQEAGHHTEAEGDTLTLGGEAAGQVEGAVLGIREEAGAQAEGSDNEGETKEQQEGTLESMNTPNEVKIHSIQLENDEI